MTSQIVKSFTGLRGISCFTVLLWHFGGPLSFQGPMAVAFFFTLSGYLLFKTNLQQVLGERGSRPRRFHSTLLLKYMAKRFFRIYPAFMVSYGIYKLAALGEWASQIRKYFPEPFWEEIILLKNDDHFWTMTVECTFFFIAMPIAMIILSEVMVFDYNYLKGKPFKLVPLVYAAMLGVTIWISVSLGYVTNLHRIEVKSFYQQSPPFVFGMLCGAISVYLKYFKITVPPINTRFRKILVEVITWGLMIRIFFSNREVAANYKINKYGEEPLWQSQLLVAPFYALLLLALDLTKSSCFIGRFMAQEWVYFLGQISYSTYLIHKAVQYYMDAFVTNKIIFGFEALTAAIILSNFMGWLIYILVEDKGVKLGNYVIKKIEKWWASLMTRCQVMLAKRFPNYKNIPPKIHDLDTLQIQSPEVDQPIQDPEALPIKRAESTQIQSPESIEVASTQILEIQSP